MSERSASWRPGQTVCRCCLAEGCYKDISTEYFWMGKREVYADMLLDTFDVNISFSQAGGPGSSSRLICEPCISRLRDASEFKRQVLECEKAFVQQLEPGSSAIDVDDGAITLTGSEIKVEAIKLEKSLSDDEDFHDAPNFDDDDDDLDDQPLTTFASRVPKKESVDILELLDTEKTPEKRKMPVRAKATPAKKLKAAPKTVVAKAATSKTATKTGKVDTKKKELTNINVARWNGEIVVKFTTAVPFKLPGDHMKCIYCGMQIENPDEFMRHANGHEIVDVRRALRHVGDGCFLKVNFKELKCRLCWEQFERLDDVASHLKTVHRAKLNLLQGSFIMPYKCDSEKLSCGICDARYAGLRQLSRHMSCHFPTYQCEVCSKFFINKCGFNHHKLTCNEDTFVCRCHMRFKTKELRREHFIGSEACWPYACKDCDLRFKLWKEKQEHLTAVHKLPSKTYKCPECSAVFERQSHCAVHFHEVHGGDSEDANKCKFCGKFFLGKKALQEHVVTHTQEKNFTCDVCSKVFGAAKHLKQHSWIHTEVKRFSCSICDRKFNQRVCLKGHMKTHHPEVDFK